jgi:DNA-binding IclR family transcriptional regulator
VVDKTVAILDAVASAPKSLLELVDATGLSRPTAHRLAVALEHHGALDRDRNGRFVVGPRIGGWASRSDPLLARSEQAVVELRDRTGASAQVYRRVGSQRLCLASAEPPSGLRDTVPVGSLLTMSAGSAAQVLVAWLDDDERALFLANAAYTEADLARVRRRGWAHTRAQREPGVASISVPVRSPDGFVIAALSISGPVDLLASPTAAQREALESVAAELTMGRMP